MLGPFALNKAYQGNCLDLMKGIPDGSVHAIVMDPPYGNGNTHVRAGNISDLTRIANDDEDELIYLLHDVFRESARILDIKESAILSFAEGGGPSRVSNKVSDCMARYLEFVSTLVWDKRIPGMGFYYRRSHEFIFVGHKKGSKLRWYDQSCAAQTVLNFTRIVNPPEGHHPTPKPVPLMEYLIRNHTKRGDVILDPCCGGGATLVAAKKLGRKFIGFDLDKRWVDLSNKRIEQEEEQLDLFGG